MHAHYTHRVTVVNGMSIAPLGCRSYVQRVNDIERMTAAAAKLGLTDADLARALGTTQQTIWNWRMRANIPKHRLMAVADVLHVRPEWLLTGRGEPEPTVALDSQAADLALRWLQLAPHHRKTVSDLIDALIGDPPGSPSVHEGRPIYRA